MIAFELGRTHPSRHRRSIATQVSLSGIQGITNQRAFDTATSPIAATDTLILSGTAVFDVGNLRTEAVLTWPPIGFNTQCRCGGEANCGACANATLGERADRTPVRGRWR